jgi:hypothetical protein
MIPICPNCKAKFSHDAEKECCKKCGLPDEVRERGEGAVVAWHEQTLENKRLFGRIHARTENRPMFGMSKRENKKLREKGRQRRRNKHGRVGKHAA